MIQVHEIFVCKPGHASKVAKMFKEVLANNKEFVNIITDMTGQFNRVIIVTQYEDLVGYQNAMEGYMIPTDEQKKQFAKMEGYAEMYQTGSREIFKVV